MSVNGSLPRSCLRACGRLVAHYGSIERDDVMTRKFNVQLSCVVDVDDLPDSVSVEQVKQVLVGQSLDTNLPDKTRVSDVQWTVLETTGDDNG